MIATHLHTYQNTTRDQEETMTMLDEVAELFGFESTRAFLDVRFSLLFVEDISFNFTLLGT